MLLLDGKKLILHPPGHEKMTLTKWEVVPGDLGSLIDYFDGKACTFKFVNCTVLEDDSITELSVGLTLPRFADSVAIVGGGWLPPSLALPFSKVFADRNFISSVLASYMDGKNIRKEVVFTEIEDVQSIPFSLDVLPFVLEANKKNFPTRALMDEQFFEVVSKLKKSLPKIPIHQYQGIDANDYAEKLLNFLRPKMEKRQKFLYEFTQKFPPNSAAEKILQNWMGIAKLAAENELEPNDFMVLVVMLATSSSQSGWPGAGVLKLDKQYSMELAYNAVCDLMLLEFLLNHQDKYPEQNYVAMTGDKNLAKLAAALKQLRSSGSNGATKGYTTSLSLELFKGNQKLAKKFQRIISGQMVELISLKELKPGDIFLCYSGKKLDPIRGAINKVTGSPYSHSGIYLGNRFVFESVVVEGVKKTKIRDFIGRYSHVAVFRQPDAWHQKNVDALNLFAKRVLERDARYNLSGIVRFTSLVRQHSKDLMRSLEDYFSGRATPRPTIKEKYFCSELVADCFADVGFIAPSAAMVYRSDAISPVALASDPTFGTFVGYTSLDGEYEVPVDDEFYHRATFKEIFGP